MSLLGIVPEYSHKFYKSENLHHLEPYVRQLIANGFPLWMVDEERRNFRTAQDTGANEGYFRCWNAVRKAHGFPKLTIDELWQRHADSNNWTDEYRDFNKRWLPIWYNSYSEYRDGDNSKPMKEVVINIPEFVGTKYKD